MQPAPRSTATLAAAALAILCLFAADRAAAQCVDKLQNGQVLVLDWGAIFLIDDVSIGADPDSNQQSVCGGQCGSALTNDRLGRLWVATGDDAVRIDPAETRLHAGTWTGRGRPGRAVGGLSRPTCRPQKGLTSGTALASHLLQMLALTVQI